MTFTDRTLICQDCGADFVFTAGEQGFYAEKGFTDPKRCQECRAKRKERYGKKGKGGRHRQ